MIHLSDTTAAYVGVIGGLLVAVLGALLPSATWERMYGTPAREGKLYAPVLRRIPRPIARAGFITMGIVMVLSGVLLFALGRA